MGSDLGKWQVSFIVEGLHAPKKDMTCDEDLLIRRHGEADDEAEVYIKITEEEAKDNKTLYRPFQRKFDQILQLYGLETKMHAKRPSGWSTRPITEDIPFGQPPAKGYRIFVKSTYPPGKIENLYSAFEFAVRKQETIKQVFEDNSKAFIRHGLEYFYMALDEDTIEKKVIDLFIALESLFSKDQELRFRISLRVSSLLGSIGKDRTKVFRCVYDLYSKRSRVVHGVTEADLSWDEVFELERYVRDCLRILIHLDMGKDDIIDKLDTSLYDDGVKPELQRLATEAYEKWKR